MTLWLKAYEKLKEIGCDTYQDFAKSDDCDEIKAMFTKEELTVLLMKILLDNE